MKMQTAERKVRRSWPWKNLERGRCRKASNLAWRPAQQRNRNATTSACLGWD